MIENFLNIFKYKKKICIITGKNVYKNIAVSLFINKIYNKNTKIFFKLKPYPEYLEIKKLQKKIKIFYPDIIVSVGGGSVLDCSKIIYQNISCKKLILIPTTAGSGAEATKFAVLYKNKNKFSVKISKKFESYLFPDLTLNVPESIKSSSTFDALAQ
jgi:alcohol dehydrogenase class IV